MARRAPLFPSCIHPSPNVTGQLFPSSGGALALTSVAQWAGCLPTKHKVIMLIPGWGRCLGCGFSPQSEGVQEAAGRCFSLTLMFLCLSSSLTFPLSKEVGLCFPTPCIWAALGSYFGPENVAEGRCANLSLGLKTLACFACCLGTLPPRSVQAQAGLLGGGGSEERTQSSPANPQPAVYPGQQAHWAEPGPRNQPSQANPDL